MENLNFLRKIAWSFHRSTNQEWDDLFQDIALIYLEALKDYDPEKGEVIPFVKSRIVNQMRNKWRKAIYSHIPTVPLCYANGVVLEEPDLLESLSHKETLVVRQILTNFDKYSMLTSRRAKEELGRVLVEEENWNWCQVWDVVKELKQTLSY